VLVVAGAIIAVISIRGHGSSSVSAPVPQGVRPESKPTGPLACQSGQVQVSSLGGDIGAGNVA
jgi:hypothetical protein